MGGALQWLEAGVEGEELNKKMRREQYWLHMYERHIHMRTCLGVWGEIKNLEPTDPSSQGWAPRHPTHFVIACLYTHRFVVSSYIGSVFPSSLSLQLLAT